MTDRLLSLIRLPKGRDILLLSLFLAIFAFGNAFKLNGDSTLGYTVTEALINPNLFNTNDLIANSSSGIYLFYRTLSHLPFFQNNFVVRDFVIFVPLTILIILGWYNIFFELTKDRRVIILALFFLLFADDKLYINGMAIPFFTFTSIGSVYFLQVFAFYFFIRQRYLLSFALFALTSYFHPGAAFSYLLIFGILYLFIIRKSKDYVALFKVAAVSLLIILPNIYFLANNIGSSFDKQLFLDIFNKLMIAGQAGHSHLEVYFKRGYLYLFGILGLLYVNYHKNQIRIEHQRLIFGFVSVSIICSIAWLINLYFIHNLQFLFTLFIGRAFYFLRPLLLFLIVHIFFNLIDQRNRLGQALAILLISTLILFPSWFAFILTLPVSLYFMLERFWPAKVFSIFNHDNFSGRYLKVVIGLVLIFSVAIFCYRFNNKLYKAYRLMRGENLFNFSFDKERNYEYSKSAPDYSSLVDWAKQFHGKIFYTPLLDSPMSTSFRYLTKNSIYISFLETGQLSYSPKDYIVGYNRLLSAGFKLKNDGSYDVSGYNDLRISDLKRMNTADYIIFDKLSVNYHSQTDVKPVFENNQYIVYSLR